MAVLAIVALASLVSLAIGNLWPDEPAPPVAASPGGADLPPAGFSASLAGNPSGDTCCRSGRARPD